MKNLGMALFTVSIMAVILPMQVRSQPCTFCPTSVNNGSSSSTLGYGNSALGGSSTVIGFRSEANQQGSIAIGKDLVVSRNYSIVIGSGKDETRRLINNIPQSLMIGFDSEYPTIFVSQPQAGYNTGRIGIGNVTAPQAKLHIRADATEPATLRLEATGTLGDNIFSRILFTSSHIIQAADNQNFTFTTQSTKHFVFQNGNVGIGIASPRGKLDVLGNAFIEGIVYTEEVIVEDASNWPDYVFEPDYQLMNLADLKNYIDINKHLPDTPKADENGNLQNLKLGEMNGLLLKKIEELTLYILEQEDRIKRLENALEQ